MEDQTTINNAAGGQSGSTDGLCGCGREARYTVTRDGKQVLACNKYMRCPTYDEQGEALKQANLRLLNLLALIHRDGGHHITEVGIQQALKDAEQVLYKWRGAYDVLMPHNAKVSGGGAFPPSA